MSTLICYFTAEFGNTKALAERFADITGGDLFEIVPEKPYSKGDLRYINPLARCNREWAGKKQVPVKELPESLEGYDTILIGLPIWYGCAPNVVNFFCDKLDFTGKKLAVFATSGGSKIGKTGPKLEAHTKGVKVLAAEVFNSASDNELKNWFENL